MVIGRLQTNKSKLVAMIFHQFNVQQIVVTVEKRRLFKHIE